MSPAPPTAEHELLPRGRSAAQLAYDYVKARLLDGRFAGGTLLSENEIAQRLDVSRTPVRQAFVQLEAEGLLELYPKRGAPWATATSIARSSTPPASPGLRASETVAIRCWRSRRAS